MVGSGSGPPPEVDPRSSDLRMLLSIVRATIDREVTEFNEAVEAGEPANTGRENKNKKSIGAGEHSGVETHDNTDTDEGVLFKNFKRLPPEIRSKIWVAAGEAARPCGIYHFMFKSVSMRPGAHPGLGDTVLASLSSIQPSPALFRTIQQLLWWKVGGHRVQTITPSAAVIKMTRGIRDLLRSCSEARAELMRCPDFSSSFDFYYLKGGKCNAGTIRPFLYDTDWVSMDGLNLKHKRSVFRTDLGTRDIKRIQHFALPYDGFDRPELFHRGGLNSGGQKSAHIFRWLHGLKSVGLYAPSVTIKRARNWEMAIRQGDRLFLKCFPAPVSSRVSAPSWNMTEHGEAMEKLTDLVSLMGQMYMQKTVERWPASTCDFGALQFCFIIHADNRKGLDLMKFKEDGSHLDDVDLDDLGKMGDRLKWLPHAADYFKAGGR
ncbi:hypothetical protein KVR01_004504 [Diaporthe batatas]|uniref:uncharacterized protein n=1 Tax=Diaporthe batatas TaxID=748121 RepID=UPI001D057947|nr:uncharacterized protein KVR01_004504 [Diaporthe batatas]KAG8165952.1 hypothetical protein KVR01_004504 [Diaporthe batatas]